MMSTIHVLILVPVFFALMKERALRRGTLQPQENNG
jgi:Cu(I)/Ag(I) efflux system membrane protein CusA/SilA